MYIRMVALAKKMANLVDWRDPEQMLNPQSYTLVGPAPCPSAAHGIIASSTEAVHV